MKYFKFKTIIIIITGICLIFSIFFIFSLNTYSQTHKNIIIDKIYNETCRHSNRMNELFQGGESVINTLHANIITHFNVAKFKSEPDYLDSFLDDFRPTIKASVPSFKGGSGLFLTFDPALKDYSKPYEVWYAYDENGRLQSIDASANGVYMEAFQEPDAPYMQFFFKSIKKKNSGVWTEIHYDPDIKKEVFGYCRAIFKKDLLLGVIGTTISTVDLYQTAKKMDIENDGYILLLSENNDLMQSFTKKNNLYQETHKVPPSLINLQKPNQSGSQFATIEGEKMLVTYSKLSNGWTFAIANNANEIFRTVQTAQILFTAISILLSLIIVCFSYLAMKNYVSPTEKAINLLKTLDLDHDQCSNGHLANIDDIESFARQHVERQRAKDIQIAQRARQAEMGEMLETVMHQWKQPLNRINIIMANLRDSAADGNVTEPELLSFADRTENTVAEMAQILDDFKEYMKPDRETSVFNINDLIEATLTLLSYNLKKHTIKLLWSRDETLPLVHGYKNALYHVLLNVISNGIEAIEECDIADPVIEIQVTRNVPTLQLDIFNTGYPLSQNVQDNLFKPYFTTKGDSGGSGIGLIISKNLIETMMGGSIHLKNKQDGVLCSITIKYGGEDNV